MASVSIENFIKTIYKQTQIGEEFVKTKTVANLLEISNAAVCDMANKIAKVELIEYVKYKGIKLKKKGEELAINVLRKHRLWETFLHTKLGFPMYDVHNEADALEHVTSDLLADRLDSFLGYPQFDPHGTPIPDSEGVITYDTDTIPLNQIADGGNYKVMRISVKGKDFFEICKQFDLKIGKNICVSKIYNTTDMIKLDTKGSTLLLHKDITNHIWVKKTKK